MKGQKFDGLIITGAPIEHLAFDDVTYWDDCAGDGLDPDQCPFHLRRLLGGMAAMTTIHGVPKHLLTQGLRLFPPPQSRARSPYLRGFSDDFGMPVSRRTEMRQAEIPTPPPAATAAGLRGGRPLSRRRPPIARSMFNHFEYDNAR